MLFGVEAPAVRPTVTAAGGQPVPGHDLVDGRRRRRSDRAVSDFVLRHQARRFGDVVGPHAIGADPGEIARIAAVVARPRRSPDRAGCSSSKATTASCRSWVALQIVSNARKCSASAASPYRSVIAARSISPTRSDSLISIVVWFAQPTRDEVPGGIEAG